MDTGALSPTEDFEIFLQQHLGRELLRFSTAGSVDDGKSTLIGRLLHDSKSVFEDQLASIRKSRVNRSGKDVDLSLLTDGLKAEREQGITIDVAYRYFSTPRRKFIIADTPGHEQYTRNMATGASTADLSLILIDASKGLLPQSRRHTFISSLLRTPHTVAVVNKMDLVGYDQGVFERIQRDFLELAAQLELKNLYCIPVSALEGDNVVHGSENMRWYTGLPLLELLETVPVPVTRDDIGTRFPVQFVVRPDASFRGFAGQVESGRLRVGDQLVALPSRQRTSIRRIVSFDGDLTEAHSPMGVTLQLEDEIDLSRGDMLVSPAQLPHASRHFEAMVVWMHADPMRRGQSYLLKHTTRQLRAKPSSIRFRVDINTLEHLPAETLELNDIACVEFQTATPIFFDPYAENRTTGGFILVDPITNATVAAGMIGNELDSGNVSGFGADLLRREVSAQERRRRYGHAPYVIVTALHPELAVDLERALFDSGFEVLLLKEGDVHAERVVEAIRVLRLAGIVTLYSSAHLVDEFKRRIRQSIPAEEFVDLDRIVAQTEGTTTAEQVIASIRELRQRKDPDGEIEWFI